MCHLSFEDASREASGERFESQSYTTDVNSRYTIAVMKESEVVVGPPCTEVNCLYRLAHFS